MKATTVLTLIILTTIPTVAQGALVPADHPLFETDKVHVIRLYFEQDDFWEILTENYEEEIYLEAGFEWEEYVFDSVGVRFKGWSSFVANPTMKKSFKIDFDVFTYDQNIQGLYKINLNCNFNDPSFIREAAAYEISAAAGVPGPRTTFAALYINDTYWGLYTLVEQFDKHFVEERFGESEDGNLWKGDDHGSLEFLGWNAESYYGDYQLKTNESENDWTSLIELTFLLNNTSVNHLPDTLSEVMDVNTALALLAVDNLLVNLDSYSGRCANYYLYHRDRDDIFVFGEWDMNESWGCFNSWGYSITQLQELDPYWVRMNRPLAEILWSVDQYRDIYEGHLIRLMALEANPDVLLPRMEEMRDLIRDWVYLEECPRSLFSPDQFEQAMDYNILLGPGKFAPALSIFVENRYEYLKSILGTWEPVDDLVINELMAGNDSTVMDENGDYSDWIEIANRGSEPIYLSDFRLTDDMAFPERFIFPDTVIQPGEYMIIWADNEVSPGTLHTEFKLDKNGEEVYLLQDAVIVDQITFPDIENDVSWGRWPDLQEEWTYQAYSTPGEPNSNTPPEQGGSSSRPYLSIFSPNPICHSSTELTITGESGVTLFSMYDISGRLVSNLFQGYLNNHQTVLLDTSNLAAGVYVLRLAQAQAVTSELVTVIK